MQMKPGVVMGHQHALRAGRVHIDVADIYRDAQERDQMRGDGEKLGRAGRLPVGNDDLATGCGPRQRLRVKHRAGFVEPHGAELAQLAERALAIVILQHVGDVGEEDAGHESLRTVKRPVSAGIAHSAMLVKYGAMSQTTVKPRTKVKPKTQRPPLWKVILLNDDFTPREFVVVVLKAVFRMNEDQAYNVMMTAHGAALA